MTSNTLDTSVKALLRTKHWETFVFSGNSINCEGGGGKLLMMSLSNCTINGILWIKCTMGILSAMSQKVFSTQVSFCIKLKSLQEGSPILYIDVKLLNRESPILCISLKPPKHLISHRDQVPIEGNPWRGFQGHFDFLSLLSHQLRFYFIYISTICFHGNLVAMIEMYSNSLMIHIWSQ